MDSRLKGITFNEKEHRCLWNGTELYGITGSIGKMLDKEFPDNETVQLACTLGSDTHAQVEHYFNDGVTDLSTQGAKWCVKVLEDNADKWKADKTVCELMVSDFEKTASKIDVVQFLKDGTAFLYDIKTTSVFDRKYCSLQLSVYKRLFEMNYGIKVKGLFVLGTKAERIFHIFEQDSKEVDRILKMNKDRK